MHRYVKITPDVTSKNLDTNNGDSDSSNDESAVDISVDNMETDNIDHNDDVEVNDVDDVNANVSANEHDHDDHVEDRDASVNVDHVDIFDPQNQDYLNSDMIKVLVAEGPKRDRSIDKGPKDKNSRRFSSALWYILYHNTGSILGSG
ncbi:hypothetical protein Tco_0296838 [Tanacetum coccineum]